MDRLISLQAAIDALGDEPEVWTGKDEYAQGLNNQWHYDRNAIKAVPSAQPEEQQWIPCSERLPKQGQEVICQCRASIIKVLKLDANGDWYQDANHCYMGGFVIAWMPLPEPWRGEEHETD